MTYIKRNKTTKMHNNNVSGNANVKTYLVKKIGLPGEIITGHIFHPTNTC